MIIAKETQTERELSPRYICRLKIKTIQRQQKHKTKRSRKVKKKHRRRREKKK